MDIISRVDARSQGMKVFYTGIPCKNSHMSERSVATGSCVDCARSRASRFLERVGVEYRAAKSKRHYENNKDTYIKRGRLWQAAHPEITKYHRDKNNRKFRENNIDYFKQWWRLHPNKASEYNSRAYAVRAKSNWRQCNRGHTNYLSRRRQRYVRQATPGWADCETIKQLYVQASTLSEVLGVVHHVDHIIPLRGDLVCGLHTPDNMQIITKQANLRKGNKYIVL